MYLGITQYACCTYIDYLHVSTETIYDVSTYIISINIGLKKNRSKYSAFPPGSDYLWSLKAYTIHNTYISPSIFIGSFCLINNQSYVAVCKIEKQTNQTYKVGLSRKSEELIVYGGFHLHLLVFPFVYQFNSSIGVLFHSSFAND